VPRAEVPGQPAPALQVGRDLPGPLAGRDVERGLGARSERAVGVEAVASLEAAQRLLEGLVEELGLRGRRGDDLPRRRQPGPQGDDARVAIAPPEGRPPGNLSPLPLLGQGPVP
jgi:hypothetical protein